MPNLIKQNRQLIIDRYYEELSIDIVTVLVNEGIKLLEIYNYIIQEDSYEAARNYVQQVLKLFSIRQQLATHISPIEFFDVLYKLCQQYDFQWKIYQKIFQCFIQISILNFEEVKLRFLKSQSRAQIIDSKTSFDICNIIIKKLLIILFEKQALQQSSISFFLQLIEEQLEQRYPIDFLLCLLNCQINIKYPKHFIDTFLERFLQICSTIYHLHQRTQEIKIKFGLINDSSIIEQIRMENQCCRMGKKAITKNCTLFAQIIKDKSPESLIIFSQCLSQKQYQSCQKMLKNCKQLFETIIKQNLLQQSNVDNEIEIQIISSGCVIHWSYLNQQTQHRCMKFLKRFMQQKSNIISQRWLQIASFIISQQSKQICCAKLIQKIFTSNNLQNNRDNFKLFTKMYEFHPHYRYILLRRIIQKNLQPTIEFIKKLNETCYEIQNDEEIYQLIVFAWKKLQNTRYFEKFVQIINKFLYQDKYYKYLQQIARSDKDYKASVKNIQLLCLQIQKRKRKQLGILSKLHDLQKQLQAN